MKRIQKKSLSKRIFLNLSLVIMFCALVGARLFHVFYESFDYYREDPYRILMLWEGGFIFYGGAFGAFFGSLIFLKIKKQDWRMWADFLAPILAFGYGLGRVACFFSACCYGRTCSLPWAVNFPILAGTRHPVQLYAAFLEWGIALALLCLEKKTNTSTKVGSLFLTWLCLHSLARIFMEFFRDDFRGANFWGLSISTILSLSVLSLSLTALSFNFTQKMKKNH